MTALAVAAVVVALLVGFAAGCLYVSRRIPTIIANMRAEQIRALNADIRSRRH